MMIWLRFYYFSFLYFYRKKGEDWVPWFRSLLLVELTFFFLIMFAGYLIDPHFFSATPRNRLYNIIFNVIILLILYERLAYKGKSKAIFQEFISHPLNTKKNRIICWIIWVVSFLSPMVTAVIHKGYIS